MLGGHEPLRYIHLSTVVKTQYFSYYQGVNIFSRDSP